MRRTCLFPIIMICVLFSATARAADDLEPGLKAKIEGKIEIYKAWSADPEIINAVKQYNGAPEEQYASMTNEKWKTLSILSPEVRLLSKNATATFMKNKKDESITEGFISGADGGKVAFLSKPTNWNHKGNPKHDLPMSGKIWIGQVEMDESTGVQAIQAAFPVLDGKAPVGVIVLGFSVSKLKSE